MSMVECMSGLAPGRFAREALIASHIEQMLAVERSLPSEADCELYSVEFERFAKWADEQGIGFLPSSGHTVAAYVLDLLFGGSTLNEIADAVAGIKHMHEMARVYLDWAPISAALDFAVDDWKRLNG